MDIDLLRALNPGAAFAAGDTIAVAVVGAPRTATVNRVETRHGSGEVIAFAKDGSAIATYPATIGSENNPSPTGHHKINGVARDPKYEYNPKSISSRARTKEAGVTKRSQQFRRHGMDRSVRADLRHSWHARTGQDRQGRLAWMRPVDEWRSRGTGQHGQVWRRSRFRQIDRTRCRLARKHVGCETTAFHGGFGHEISNEAASAAS